MYNYYKIHSCDSAFQSLPNKSLMFVIQRKLKGLLGNKYVHITQILPGINIFQQRPQEEKQQPYTQCSPPQLGDLKPLRCSHLNPLIFLTQTCFGFRVMRKKERWIQAYLGASFWSLISLALAKSLHFSAHLRFINLQLQVYLPKINKQKFQHKYIL